MSKPSYPDWDVNNTHTTPLLAGHISDGFVNSEVPTSAELNQWMRLVGLWVRYIDPVLDYRWSWWSPAFGGLLHHFTVAGGGAPSYIASSGGSVGDPAVCQSGVRLAVGAVVTDIAVRAETFGGLGNAITLSLVKTKNSVTTTVFTANVTPVDSVWGDYTATLTTPETIDNSAYYLEVTDAGGNNVQIAAVGVKAKP